MEKEKFDASRFTGLQLSWAEFKRIHPAAGLAKFGDSWFVKDILDNEGTCGTTWAFVSRNLDPATIEPDHCVLRAFYEGGGLQWMLTKVGEAKASEIRRL